MELKIDVCGKVSDRRDVVEFVKEVEKYPCLYDKTLPEYANKVHNRKAWASIAKRANASIPDCRDRWRKIRISYMRSLKQQNSDKPPMRPYYLTEELHFLTPFLSITPPTTNSEITKQKETKMDFEIAHVTKLESDSENSDYCDQDNEAREISQVTFNKMPSLVNIRSVENKNETQNSWNSYSDTESPRKMFLLSILPDIESLSEQEMRVFRREVINVIDNIMNRRDSINK